MYGKERASMILLLFKSPRSSHSLPQHTAVSVTPEHGIAAAPFANARSSIPCGEDRAKAKTDGTCSAICDAAQWPVSMIKTLGERAAWQIAAETILA